MNYPPPLVARPYPNKGGGLIHHFHRIPLKKSCGGLLILKSHFWCLQKRLAIWIITFQSCFSNLNNKIQTGDAFCSAPQAIFFGILRCGNIFLPSKTTTEGVQTP